MFFFTFHEKRVDGHYQGPDYDGVARYTIIEADDAAGANERAKKLGMINPSRWSKTTDAMADKYPSVFAVPVGQLTGPPDSFDVGSELDRPLIYVHYLDGRVDQVTPRVKLVRETVTESRAHDLVEDDLDGLRARLRCGLCDAEFTVPHATDLATLVISGCYGPGGRHPTLCECDRHEVIVQQ